MSAHTEETDLDRLETILDKTVGKGKFSRIDPSDGKTYYRAWAKGDTFCLQLEVIPSNDRVNIICSSPFLVDVDDMDYDSPTAAILKQLNNLNRHEGVLHGITCSIDSAGLVEFSSNNLSSEEVPEALRTTMRIADVYTQKLAEVVFGGWILPDDVKKIGGEALAKALLGDAMLLCSLDFGDKTRAERVLDAWRLRFGTEGSIDNE